MSPTVLERLHAALEEMRLSQVDALLESHLEPNRLAREASVMPAVDMASLDEVFILSIRGGSHAP